MLPVVIFSLLVRNYLIRALTTGVPKGTDTSLPTARRGRLWSTYREDCVRRPNVVVSVSDDQGYGDLSCMGATHFRTPRLDAMAASGVRFTSFYANSAVCSPTRASLLTGR
jgi:hypothetical protein